MEYFLTRYFFHVKKKRINVTTYYFAVGKAEKCTSRRGDVLSACTKINLTKKECLYKQIAEKAAVLTGE